MFFGARRGAEKALPRSALASALQDADVAQSARANDDQSRPLSRAARLAPPRRFALEHAARLSASPRDPHRPLRQPRAMSIVGPSELALISRVG